MTTLIFLLCFCALVYVVVYVGSLLVEYDEKRKNRPQKTVDKIFSFFRWILYIPLGMCSGIVFNIIIAFLLSDENRWIISGTFTQLIFKVLAMGVIGFCFYILIPVLNKTRKLQSAAITVLLLESFGLVGLLLDDGGMGKTFVLNLISTLIVGGIAVYVIIKPEEIQR